MACCKHRIPCGHRYVSDVNGLKKRARLTRFVEAKSMGRVHRERLLFFFCLRICCWMKFDPQKTSNVRSSKGLRSSVPLLAFRFKSIPPSLQSLQICGLDVYGPTRLSMQGGVRERSELPHSHPERGRLEDCSSGADLSDQSKDTSSDGIASLMKVLSVPIE